MKDPAGFFGKAAQKLRAGRAMVRRHPGKGAGVLAALGGTAGYEGHKLFGEPSIQLGDFEDQVKRRERDRFLRNLEQVAQHVNE